MRISSKAYRDGAKGSPCTLRMPGCDGGGETTVFAHIRDRFTGRSIKASDLSGCDACASCHARLDGQAGAPLSYEDWLVYALRGLQETMHRRVEQGILIVPQDAPKARAVKPRKPKADRQKIVTRKQPWPSKKIPKRVKP